MPPYDSPAGLSINEPSPNLNQPNSFCICPSIALCDGLTLPSLFVFHIDLTPNDLNTVFCVPVVTDVAVVCAIICTRDLESVLNAIEGKPYQGGLSTPSPNYIKWANDCFGPSSKTPVTMAEKLNAFMEDWRICNGKDVLFPEEFYYQLGLQNIARGKGQTSAGNHMNAIKASYKEHREALAHINQPTLIIHGRQDPALGIDHAESLNKTIFGSKLFLIDKMGHTINPQHYPQIIELIVRHIKDLTFA